MSVEPVGEAGRDERRPMAILALAAASVAVVAWFAGGVVTLLGPGVLALLLGTALRTAGALGRRTDRAAATYGARILQVSIVALGLSVNVVDVISVARGSLPVMLGTLAVGLGGIWLIGRGLAIRPAVRGMLTVGTSICGASAIAAVAPILEAEPTEISYAVSVIFMFNITAVIVFPTLGHVLGFSTQSFGTWAGTAVNDTSSVLAAGFAFGAGAATYAAVVKLSRTVMILPVTIGSAILAGRGSGEGVASQARRALKRALPWFIVAFLIASIANASGIIPSSGAKLSGQLAQVGTVLALATIGLGTDAREVRRAGPRPLLLGLLGWLLVASTSLALQAATGTL